jgi:hypothetical protein
VLGFPLPLKRSWDVRPWRRVDDLWHISWVIIVVVLLLVCACLAAVTVPVAYFAVAVRWRALTARPLAASLPPLGEAERWTALDDQQLARFLTGP